MTKKQKEPTAINERSELRGGKQRELTKDQIAKSPKLNIFEREKEYTLQTSLDLDKLSGDLTKYLSDDGWTVQSANTSNGKLVQANKGGILREIFAADRALTILFTRESPEKLKVGIGIGKWLENVGTTIIEAAVLSTIFLVVDIPEILWNYHIEKVVMKEIDSLVEQQNPWKLIKPNA
jgi:hypothetical protein